MPADTLLAISQRAAARGASRVYSIGDLPYALAAPILAKVPSPQQLYDIEQTSPQIIGYTEDLWLSFLKRDVPNYEDKPHRPANPASWFKVYRKLKKQSEAEMKEGQDKLKAALGKIKESKELNTAQIVSQNELPRGAGGVGWKQQSRFDYMTGKTGAKGAHKMTLFEKIRKEKADTKTNKSNRPVSLKQGTSGMVRAAPDRLVQSIVEERKRIEEDRRKAASAVRAPRAPMRATGSRDEVGYDLVADREARLRALKNKQDFGGLSEPTSRPFTGRKRSAEQAGLMADDLEELFDDDLGSEDDEKEDELFGTLPTTARPPAKPRPEIEESLLKPPSAISEHRKLLDPGSLNAQRQRSASPGRIGSPGRIASPKPMAKKRAAPSLFHTSKRVATKS